MRTRLRRHRKAAWTKTTAGFGSRAGLALGLAALLGGCVTTADTDAPVDEDGEIRAEADGAEAAAEAPRSGSGGSELMLGILENEDIRQVVYRGFQTRLDKRQTLSGGGEETTEIGDYDSFQFTIVKLASGKDDVSADPTQTPDAMDVEVTGWYKKTLEQKGDEARSTCFSFDATAPVRKQRDKWVVPDDFQVVFGREDAEDCY